MVDIDIRFLKEDEFEQVYEYLKDKTNSFTEFSPDLIIENNQFLLIFRIILGNSKGASSGIGSTIGSPSKIIALSLESSSANFSLFERSKEDV